MLSKDFVPVKPFPDFKWKWASLQCTESLNDPVILLGVLFRMRKLEKLNQGIKYSSEAFSEELRALSNDTKDSIDVDLAGRTGSRNLIRNSGQYWRALNLIAPGDRSGKIRLTNFGREVADHEISQTEFAAITVQSFHLPNPQVQSQGECTQWVEKGLILYPLRLLLEISCELRKRKEGYITPDENAVPARINAAVLNRIVELQQTVLDAVPNARELSVSDLLSMPGVMVNDRLDQDAVSSAVLAVLNNALDAFTATRAREGEALASVLLNNCQQIEEVVTEVKGRMPEILAHIEGKLKERLENALCTALTETSTLTREEVSDRIRQEVTLYAMRMDVEEEINRLYTHVTEVRRILNKGGAVGRRLDFVVQEMNREANTLGSKAAAIEMTNASLALKVVIEQMREQIQNLE